MALVFIVSCGETGGTIVIENDDSTTWSVAIGSSSARPDSTNILPGQSYKKVFITNGTYYAFGYFYNGWRTKIVPLSGGETVTLRTDDF